MTPPILIAPDGAQALAALIQAGSPAPLTPALAALVARSAAPDEPIAVLAAVYARRRQHCAPASSGGRAPAARFMRRQHRRWRVTQSADFTERFSIEALERAGRRAQRRDAGWPQATALAAGVWHAFWAIEHVRDRRDLLAMLPVVDARRVAQTPIEQAQARRYWR
ncbi:MAG: hypothetical protein ACI9U2_003106 [Bradymonadia bacterium]|jgi:hypothetical protein